MDLDDGVAAFGDRVHIGGMAKSAADVTFEPRPLKTGPGWLVVVTFPDQPPEQINDFPTESDAKNWITNDSQAWLKKRGYEHD
jgi:hypothetical protein